MEKLLQTISSVIVLLVVASSFPRDLEAKEYCSLRVVLTGPEGQPTDALVRVSEPSGEAVEFCEAESSQRYRSALEPRSP